MSRGHLLSGVRRQQQAQGLPLYFPVKPRLVVLSPLRGHIKHAQSRTHKHKTSGRLPRGATNVQAVFWGTAWVCALWAPLPKQHGQANQPAGAARGCRCGYATLPAGGAASGHSIFARACHWGEPARVLFRVPCSHPLAEGGMPEGASRGHPTPPVGMPSQAV